MAIQADGEGKDFTEDLEDFGVDEGDCTTAFEDTGVDEEDRTSLSYSSSKQEGRLLLLLNITSSSSSKSCSTVSAKSSALDFSDRGL